MNEDKVKKDIVEIKTINIELDHRVSKLIAENEHLKQTYKQLYDSIKPTPIRSKEQCDALINQVNQKSVEISDLNVSLREKGLVITTLKDELRKLKGKYLADDIVTKHTIAPEMLKFDVEPIAPKLLNNRTTHSYYLRHTQEQAAILRKIVEQGKSQNPLNNSLDFACNYIKRIQELLIIIRQTCPSITNSSDKLVVVTLKNKDKRVRFTEPITSLGNTNIKPASSSNLHSKLNANSELLCVKCNGCMLSDNHDLCVLDFINDVNAHAKSKYVKKSSKSKVWKPTRKLITTTTEVPLRKPTTFKSDTPKPVVTLVYSRKPKKSKTNVPVRKPKIIKSISVNNKEPSKSWGSIVSDVPSSSLDECRLSKLFSVKLGNDHVAKILGYGDYQIGNVIISRVYYVEGLGHNLFFVGKKKPYKPKYEDTNQEKLYLLHMDLCCPMRVVSVNGKKYILVIVDDYSRFTWVKCLRSKDEAPDFIIKFLKMIQLRLKAPVRRIITDNGTEFVNQTLREYYEKVGIYHETSVARSPQQNGVVERRNCTLIEAARTMLIYAKAPLFLWAETVATACYTQNRSIICLRLSKTPENLGKLQPKADIGIFIGYAPTKKAFRIYNRRTRRIIKTIHVDFDELTAMASEHNSLEPALYEMTPATISSGFVPNPPPSTPFVPPSRTDWDILFQPLFDEYSNPPSI
ncbi:retrovirus-related pol polyprotein from transposon TNT 1-94 [Tanacetum coccineum]